MFLVFACSNKLKYTPLLILLKIIKNKKKFNLNFLLISLWKIITQKIFVVEHSAWHKMKENYQIYLPYQFCPKVQSVGGDLQLPNKKIKTLFLSNKSKSRRLTSTFFPIIIIVSSLSTVDARISVAYGRRGRLRHKSSRIENFRPKPQNHISHDSPQLDDPTSLSNRHRQGYL